METGCDVLGRVSDEGIPPDEAAEVDRHGVGAWGDAVRVTEHHTGATHHLDQLLSYQPIPDGGGMHAIQREQTAARAATSTIAGKEPRIRYGVEGIEFRRQRIR